MIEEDTLKELTGLVVQRLSAADDPRRELGDLLAGADRRDVLDWIPTFKSSTALVEHTLRTLERRGQIDASLFAALLEEDVDEAWGQEVRQIAHQLGAEPGLTAGPVRFDASDLLLDLAGTVSFEAAPAAAEAPAADEAAAAAAPPSGASGEAAAGGERAADAGAGREAAGAAAAGREMAADASLGAEVAAGGARSAGVRRLGRRARSGEAARERRAEPAAEAASEAAPAPEAGARRSGAAAAAPGRAAKSSLERVIAAPPGGPASFRVADLQRLLSTAAAVGAVRAGRSADRPAPSWFSTGWLLAPGLLVVPSALARHAGSGEIEVSFEADGATAKLVTRAVPAYVPDDDLSAALLRLEEPYAGPVPPVARTVPEPGARLSLIGHVELGPKSIALAALAVEGVRDQWLRYRGPTGRGTMGAPVVDDAGRVVAVHLMALEREDDGLKEGVLIEPFLRACRRQEPALWAEVVAAQPELRDLDPRLELYLRGEPTEGELALSIELAPTPVVDLDRVPDLRVLSRVGSSIGASGTERSIRQLWNTSGVIGLRLADDRGASEMLVSLPFIGAAAVHASPAPYGERGSSALIGIVDDGIDVLHQAFAGDDGTRILLYWDARDASGPRAHSAAGQDLLDLLGPTHGVLYVKEDIDGFRAGGGLPAGFPADVAHGTAVASVAAGRATEAIGGFAGGVAPESKIAVVRYSQSIGFTDSVAQALQALDRFATRLGLPLVVNLSQGTNAGPHDGESKLERFCARFSEEPGRVIVKSAGNQATSARHAAFKLSGGERELTLSVPPGERDVRLELWHPHGNRYRFRVGLPTGAWSDEHTPPKIESSEPSRLPNGNHLTIVQQRRHPDNGEGYMELAIEPGSLPAVQDGPWQLRVTAESAQEPDKPVHVWLDINRNTTLEGPHVEVECTLTTPGTTGAVITVGARNGRDPRRAVEVSSFGPTRRGDPKPDVCAPGHDVYAALAGTGTGVEAVSGSSIAAPHVTGAVALLLSASRRAGRADPNARQVVASIRSEGLLETPVAGHDDQFGWGSLSVLGLLRGWDLGPP